MSIPQYKPLVNREKLAKEVSDYILSDGYFTEYLHTKKFEENLAKTLGVSHCFVVNNGTISLSLALLAHGIKAGDHVIIPNVTMIATCNAVKFIGAIPVFVDIDKRNMCLDLDLTMEEIKVNTLVKAVIYVSLNGRTHDVEEYEKFKYYCNGLDIKIVEDNAQSFGSRWNNNCKIGSSARTIGSFSFSMPKIFTTGQGGCLVTNDQEMATTIKRIKDFGRDQGGGDVHNHFGINSKFTEIQAIMGNNQLESIEKRIKTKKEIYNLYYEELKNIPQVTFLETNLEHVTPWFIDIYIKNRNELMSYLKCNEIGSRAIYPELTGQLCNNCENKSLPISKKFSEEGLWLPSSLDISFNQIKTVCNMIKSFYSNTFSTIKDLTLYHDLKHANVGIRDVSANFKYVQEGQEYDLKNDLISGWFNPDRVKHSATSRIYPKTAPEQLRPEYSLILYPANYLCLMLVNKLYSDNKNILIEDIGCGVGHLLVYLKESGFSNFHVVENFSQTSQHTLDLMAEKFNFKYYLNQDHKNCKVINCSAIFEPCLITISDKTELVCFYTNPSIIKWSEENLLTNGFVELGKDQDNFQVAYCRKEKFEEFNEKLKEYRYE